MACWPSCLQLDTLSCVCQENETIIATYRAVPLDVIAITESGGVLWRRVYPTDAPGLRVILLWLPMDEATGSGSCTQCFLT